MHHNQRAYITESLLNKSTDTLLEIWHNHDTDEWEEIVFEIIEDILTERLGTIPPPPPNLQCKRLLQEAENLFDNGNLEEALFLCKQAIQINPNSSDAYDLIGNIYTELSQPEDALDNFRQSILLNPEQEDFWKDFLWAEAQVNSDFKNSAAKQNLDQALEYIYDNEPEKALEMCEQVKTYMPTISIANNYLGLIYETMQQIELAIEAYTKATQLNPRFVPAWENLSHAKRYHEEELYIRASRRGSEDIQELSEMEFLMDGVDISDQVDSDDLIPGWYYLQPGAVILPGTPGYRTRPGRSGYDQLDSQFEEGRVEGIILTRLITCKLRTDDPFNLFFMANLAIILCMPLFVLFTLLLLEGVYHFFGYLILFSPCWIIGLAFCMNVILSIFHPKDGNLNDDGCTFY